jgi:hypothetical protein
MYWDEFLKPSTDVARLTEIATLLHENMRSAQQSMRSLMAQNANSIPVLRMYASFLIGATPRLVCIFPWSF